MQKRNLSFTQLFNLSFGFFGVQIAYALQSANISRIFSSLGADPHSLSFFWVLPPLMGMLVQPLVGKYSDRTWNKLGRRKPYLLIGAIIAVAVMLTLPNASTMVRIMGLAINQVLWFGVFALIFLDTSINIAMQPFKMMVGDMVNEEQKGKAYAIQSFLCNAGSLVGFVLPYVLALFAVSNTAAIGEIPNTVKFSFYIGALILILCVLYTFFAVKEMNPEEYAKFHGLENKKKDEPTPGLFKLLLKAPKTFWTISLVQFFCWAAFLYMWNYTTGAIAEVVWDTTDPVSEPFQEAGNWVGILFAVQAMGSVVWATILPQFKNTKMAYAVSLLLGAVGFALVPFLHDQYLQFIPFVLIGCAWAAMLAMPFTFVTNALQGYGHMGAYLGLFNGTICIPQIVAALCGGVVLSLVGSHQSTMMIVSGVLLVCGALSVSVIKDKK